MENSVFKETFLEQYNSIGKEKFYRFLLTYAINQIVKCNLKEYSGAGPEMELLDCSDKFLALYRQEENEIYLDLARIFRKAAHRIYRLRLKQNTIKKSHKFLNSV